MTWTGEDRRKGHDLEELISKAVETGGRKVAEDVVRQTVPTVVKETLKGIGIDADDPLAVQRNMQYVRDAAARANDPEVAKDRSWTRQNRRRCEKVIDGITSNLAGAGVKVLLWLLFAGAVVWIVSAADIINKFPR